MSDKHSPRLHFANCWIGSLFLTSAMTFVHYYAFEFSFYVYVPPVRLLRHSGFPCLNLAHDCRSLTNLSHQQCSSSITMWYYSYNLSRVPSAEANCSMATMLHRLSDSPSSGFGSDELSFWDAYPSSLEQYQQLIGLCTVFLICFP